jgi:1-acyl-sn-glycerol-3-phosphate acyltransferase
MKIIANWFVVNILAPIVVFVAERIYGWGSLGDIPTERKYMLLAEPHTSNYDLVVMFYWACKQRRRIHFVIKRETQDWFLVGHFLEWAGAIFIDRNAPLAALKSIIRASRQTDDFIMLIAPSGTRAYTQGWKPGFYFIAQKANLTLVPGAADYGRKLAVVGEPLHPTGDIDADIAAMRPFYDTITARHPEQASPVALMPEVEPQIVTSV